MTARGWVAVWTLLALAGSLLALAAHEAGPMPGDIAVTRALQGLSPEGIVGLSLTYLDDAVYFLLAVALAVALLWRRWSAALFLLVAGGTGLLVGYGLKFLVARPRPPIELSRVVEEGYGFPSTTTLFAAVILGVVCYLVRGASRAVVTGALAVSILMAVAVGLSRVYLGEHWPTDVLGAYLFGLVWVLVLIAGYRRWFDGPAKTRADGEA